MKPVLFLDFDGVLHPETALIKDALLRLPLVEEILREFPAVEIVISSAWRLDWAEEAEAVANLRRHFSPDIAQRVVGVTPFLGRRQEKDLAPLPNLREVECLNWLKSNRPAWTPWLALDDRDWWFSPGCPNLMKVDGGVGFMPSHENVFRQHLTRITTEPKNTSKDYMTLFLDFDGVLHPDPCAEEVRFCRRNLVQNILREFPQVDIVLTTTWRLRDPLDSSGTILKRHFSGDIAERIVGVTPNHKDLDRSQAPDGMDLYPREWECIAWLRANRPYSQHWLALDDKAYLFRPFNKNLMVTNAATGFVSADESRLRQLLRERVQ